MELSFGSVMTHPHENFPVLLFNHMKCQNCKERKASVQVVTRSMIELFELEGETETTSGDCIQTVYGPSVTVCLCDNCSEAVLNQCDAEDVLNES